MSSVSLLISKLVDVAFTDVSGYEDGGTLSRRLRCLVAFRTFVRFVLFLFCWFPLPLGIWEGLRFVIMALRGCFFKFWDGPAMLWGGGVHFSSCKSLLVVIGAIL